MIFAFTSGESMISAVKSKELIWKYVCKLYANKKALTT